MTMAETIQILTQTHEWVTISILFGSALLEYLFPPFPGDTVTLAGAVLVTAFDYSFPVVFTAVLAGSLVGSALDYWIGTLVKRRTSSRLLRMGVVRKAIEGADRAVDAFARHGDAYIAINRFLPGIRGFLFVAAGMAGMHFGRVMFFAALSAVAWNLLVIGVGMLVGAGIDDVENMFLQYQRLIWFVMTVVVIFLIARWCIRRRKWKK
ncbi:MAG: DedA family protein [Deltaproteobacteria bacterium]|nr:DedA family protein [Deltaproteobacteria bacterium]